ncbi:MAG: hypothetical protein AB1846_07475 [Chloroflexota bacterium]
MGQFHRLARYLLLIVFTVSSIAIAVQARTGRVVAAPVDPPGPDRFAATIVDYVLYEWWLAEWEDDEVHCSLEIEHEGVPTPDEIYVQCGEDIYDLWVSQPPCPGSGNQEDRITCEGFYIYQIRATPSQKEVAIPLPPPEVWLALPNCTPTPTSTNQCPGRTPRLRLIGMEPLPGYKIVRLAGELNGEAFSCDDAAACGIPITETDEEGVPLDFWAYSSYGDSSEILSARLRVLPSPDSTDENPLWLVDVLSPQWAGAPLLSCAESWDAFPPTEGLPAWLTPVQSYEELATNIPYDYLAGNLISRGLVDVSMCVDSGLLGNGWASPCGSQAAAQAVEAWQNQFDGLIFDISQETEIPAQLLKNLFSRESQFWPGYIPGKLDVGLGQLTEDGADTILMWNPAFYHEFCPQALDAKRCKRGYLKLKDVEREELRIALVSSVNAYCDECPLGLDLDKANFSVEVFAHALLANCEQTGRMIRNVSGQDPGVVSTYEDMWKLTLINYNAGPGCLAIALNDSYRSGDAITWDSVSAKLTPVCEGAIGYVNDVAR